MENEAILSSAEVASRLGVTSQTVTRLSRNGELNYALVGKRRVYRENDVISFMRKKNLCFAPADHRATEVVDSTLTAVSFFLGRLAWIMEWRGPVFRPVFSVKMTRSAE